MAFVKTQVSFLLSCSPLELLGTDAVNLEPRCIAQCMLEAPGRVLRWNAWTTSGLPSQLEHHTGVKMLHSLAKEIIQDDSHIPCSSMWSTAPQDLCDGRVGHPERLGKKVPGCFNEQIQACYAEI